MLRPLEDAYQKSYRDSTRYPRNLLRRRFGASPMVLEAFATRFEHDNANLFETQESKIDVSFRDFEITQGNGLALRKRNIHSVDSLKSWLGIQKALDSTSLNNSSIPGTNTSPVYLVGRPDCKSCFIYIYGEHSRARLRITKEMTLQILTIYQVMPEYLDLMLMFGQQVEIQDLRYTAFHEQTDLQGAGADYASSILGRSGRQYQLCFNLKGVTLTQRSLVEAEQNVFSIRQAAFYHRFDIVEGNSVWILTKGGLDLKERYKELTDESRDEARAFQTPKESFRSSLAVLLLFCTWALEDWRAYIKWMENTVDKDWKMALRGHSKNHQLYTVMDIQQLISWEEKANEVVAMLEANVDVISSLKQFYQGLPTTPGFVLDGPGEDDIAMFTARLESNLRLFKMHISRAKPVIKLIQSRTTLVREHLQSQQTERLQRLNAHMEDEAVVMRIITVVALFYLPATFVSTFFSTDIIRYQDAESEQGSFSPTAMVRWLQVTIPLTFFTLLGAWLGLKWVQRGLPKPDSALPKAKWWRGSLVQAALRPWRAASTTPKAIDLLPLPVSSGGMPHGP